MTDWNTSSTMQNKRQPGLMMKLFRWSGIGLLAVVLLLSFAWGFGALYYDGPARWMAVVMTLAIVAVFGFVRGWRRKLGCFAAWFTMVLVWWLILKPTNVADWQPDVAQLASAQIDGDEVTVRNVRNCDYRTETDFTPHWETRKVRLSQITGIDLAINYWGSPWMAHPIACFRFADAPPLCFSIETRKKKGQSYSAIGGLYRQFELVYVVADERDVIRVRTNYRVGEDIYLYHTTATADQARVRFLEYVGSLNGLRDQPRWYNAITTNCTTTIREQHSAAQRMPWDWRLLLNGKADELMYERSAIATGGLSFADLKRRAHINPAALSAKDSPDFSARIREGLPGM
ncbi:MAG: DUF4105 domain-containing protein [Verrucomicrobiales bacterium]